MKAAIINEFGGPEKLIYTDIEKPVPQNDEILIHNKIIGVGKPDYLVRSGHDPYLKNQLPGLVIGNESAGIVEAVGPDVKNYSIGDHVAMLSASGCGSHAEYSCGKEQYAIPLPEDLPFEKVAGILNLQVAYALLYDVGRGTDGKSLYISGAAGGIGTTLVQMALDKGMEVIASASTEEKCQVLKNLGAQCVFNYKAEDEKEKVLSYTNGRGVDLIYDQLAGPGLAKKLSFLADFGMIVLYNWLDGDPKLDEYQTIVKEAVHAKAIRSFSFHVYDNKTQRRLSNANCVFQMIREGRIKPVVYADLPLSEARKAHELLDSGKVIGKLIMHP